MFYHILVLHRLLVATVWSFVHLLLVLSGHNNTKSFNPTISLGYNSYSNSLHVIFTTSFLLS